MFCNGELCVGWLPVYTFFEFFHSPDCRIPASTTFWLAVRCVLGAIRWSFLEYRLSWTALDCVWPAIYLDFVDRKKKFIVLIFLPNRFRSLICELVILHLLKAPCGTAPLSQRYRLPLNRKRLCCSWRKTPGWRLFHSRCRRPLVWWVFFSRKETTQLWVFGDRTKTFV